MKFGVVFPQTEIGSDPVVIRDYAQAAEALGYQHILVYDHVLGASTANRPNWSGPYTSETLFHEPFVLFGYLAGLTQHIEFVTGVIILPQRQTALVAKQAAEVDVLSNGRLRLGVGIGWNTVEYDSLNENFKNRGARISEQVEVLRALWSQEVVSFDGRWHHIDEVGLNPLPVQRPIPIWFGGHAEPAVKRAGRLGDGWFPLRPPNEASRAMVEQVKTSVNEAGRSVDDFGIESILTIGEKSDDECVSWVEDWQALGATHLSINTMNSGFTSPQAHIDKLRRMTELLPVKQS